MITGIHEQCIPSLKMALLRIEEALGESLLGICVVGSSACSDWEEGSDIDILLLAQEKSYFLQPQFQELEDLLREEVEVRTQFIRMDVETLEEHHLKNRTTMAHSIRRGVVILDKEGHFLPFFLLTNEDLPKKEWIKKHYLHFVICHTLSLQSIREDQEFQKKFSQDSMPYHVDNNLCRAIVNYSILYLELKGIIPTTKKQILRGLQKVNFPAKERKDVERSLLIRREGLFIPEEEVYTLTHTAKFLKDKIQSLLGLNDQELEPYNLPFLLNKTN